MSIDDMVPKCVLTWPRVATLQRRVGWNPTQQVRMDKGRNRQITGYGLREDGNLSLLSQCGYQVNGLHDEHNRV